MALNTEVLPSAKPAVTASPSYVETEPTLKTSPALLGGFGGLRSIFRDPNDFDRMLVTKDQSASSGPASDNARINRAGAAQERENGLLNMVDNLPSGGSLRGNDKFVADLKTLPKNLREAVLDALALKNADDAARFRDTDQQEDQDDGPPILPFGADSALPPPLKVPLTFGRKRHRFGRLISLVVRVVRMAVKRVIDEVKTERDRMRGEKATRDVTAAEREEQAAQKALKAEQDAARATREAELGIEAGDEAGKVNGATKSTAAVLRLARAEKALAAARATEEIYKDVKDVSVALRLSRSLRGAVADFGPIGFAIGAVAPGAVVGALYYMTDRSDKSELQKLKDANRVASFVNLPQDVRQDLAAGDVKAALSSYFSFTAAKNFAKLVLSDPRAAATKLKNLAVDVVHEGQQAINDPAAFHATLVAAVDAGKDIQSNRQLASAAHDVIDAAAAGATVDPQLLTFAEAASKDKNFMADASATQQAAQQLSNAPSPSPVTQSRLTSMSSNASGTLPAPANTNLPGFNLGVTAPRPSSRSKREQLDQLRPNAA